MYVHVRLEIVASGHYCSRLYALRQGIIDDLIEPREFMDARLRLALGPAALQPDGLRTERSEEFFVVRIDPEIAVERLPADGPIG